MKVEVSLFGAFREHEPSAKVTLELADDAHVSDLRRVLSAHGRAHWPGFKDGLLQRSAFASDTRILRDGESLPANARMVVLPPVGGG
jgi:molybdopterin synthase sulfur carrier subunit